MIVDQNFCELDTVLSVWQWLKPVLSKLCEFVAVEVPYFNVLHLLGSTGAAIWLRIARRATRKRRNQARIVYQVLLFLQTEYQMVLFIALLIIQEVSNLTCVNGRMCKISPLWIGRTWKFLLYSPMILEIVALMCTTNDMTGTTHRVCKRNGRYPFLCIATVPWTKWLFAAVCWLVRMRKRSWRFQLLSAFCLLRILT